MDVTHFAEFGKL
jgi:hypothetical protein